MTITRKTVAAVVVAGGLAAGGGYALLAATPSGASGPGTSSAPSSGSTAPKAVTPTPGSDFDGRITSVDANTVIVRDLSGATRSYARSASTKVHSGPANRSTLSVGDHVHVHGSKSGSRYVATDIDVHPATIDGSVTSVAANSITVTDRDGFTRTIVTDGSTTYSIARSSVKPGAAIHAEGNVDANGTSLDADRIGSVPAGPPAPPAAGHRPAPQAPPAGHRPAAPPKPHVHK